MRSSACIPAGIVTGIVTRFPPRYRKLYELVNSIGSTETEHWCPESVNQITMPRQGARAKRATEAMIWSAVFVQTNGFGVSVMAAMCSRRRAARWIQFVTEPWTRDTRFG